MVVLYKGYTMDDNSFEQLMKLKGLTAPRITLDDIEATIKDTMFYTFPGTTLTVCCLTLINGFNVTGESACASIENFDQEVGERLALEQAKNKIWSLEGYLLRQRPS